MRRPGWVAGKTRDAGWSCLWIVALFTGCQTHPPLVERATLVEVNRLEPGIRLDIRYATPNNFTGRTLYPQARALLLPAPAQALAQAHRALKEKGYGILVYDAYRPWHVTRELWDSASEADRSNGYVADPAIGSRHNRGCAVDIGLYYLTDSRVVLMPSPFDDFSVRAHADWAGGPIEPRRSRDELRRAMEAEGFKVLPNEWWHFNYRDCDQQPLLDMPIEGLMKPHPNQP
jgi:D-alanyl-D-alanine dipeptidase